MFSEKKNVENIIFKEEAKNDFYVISRDLTEIEMKFKQHFKEKNSNFIIEQN